MKQLFFTILLHNICCEGFAQRAVFQADSAHIFALSGHRTDTYQEILQATWLINGQPLHYGETISARPNHEGMDTILFLQDSRHYWDTILCSIPRNGTFIFQYNECCGAFNVCDKTGKKRLEAHVDFRIKGQRKQQVHLGTLGEMGTILTAGRGIPLKPGCRSAMSPNIYRITLREIVLCTDTLNPCDEYCYIRDGEIDFSSTISCHVTRECAHFLFMPLREEPYTITLPRAGNRVKVR